MDGLERERRTVARRLHEQDNDIGERLVQLGNESMRRHVEQGTWNSGS